MPENTLIQIMRCTLKCDAEGCGYEETVDEISESNIGKPCPKCGSNLLTTGDFEASLFLHRMVNIVNELVGPINASEISDCALVSVNPHGNKITIEVKPNARP